MSVNSRNAIQERSEREGLFVTDVAVSDRVLTGFCRMNELHSRNKRT